MTRAVLRYFVVVNDRPQTLTYVGVPLHVAAGRLGVGPRAQHIVELWAEGDGPVGPADPDLRRQAEPHRLVVVGTGHPLPDGAQWRGTCDRTPDGFVWHLYELPADAPDG